MSRRASGNALLAPPPSERCIVAQAQASAGVAGVRKRSSADASFPRIGGLGAAVSLDLLSKFAGLRIALAATGCACPHSRESGRLARQLRRRAHRRRREARIWRIARLPGPDGKRLLSLCHGVFVTLPRLARSGSGSARTSPVPASALRAFASCERVSAVARPPVSHDRRTLRLSPPLTASVQSRQPRAMGPGPVQARSGSRSCWSRSASSPLPRSRLRNSSERRKQRLPDCNLTEEDP